MKKLLVALALMGIFSVSYTQIKYDGAFGKGIEFESKDSSFAMNFTTRFQPRWDFNYNIDDNSYVDRMTIKRARLKFDGWALSPRLIYKFELI